MDFNSALFLFAFFPMSIITYYCVPEKVKKPWLLIISILFSQWLTPKFLPILAFSICADYYISHKIYKSPKKIIWMSASLILNIGILIYFKYSNFFVHEINRLLVLNISWVQTLVPLGISFFTFKKISYMVDLYRGVMSPASFLDYALYILFFPQLPAGPIARYGEFAARTPGVEGFFDGCFRLSIGLFKKFLLADAVAVIADSVFSTPTSSLTASAALLGAFSYAIQIYLDFSAYTDMAVGIGKMFGYNSPENFNLPYVSQSITEFWRRWHMTLSGFFRDYVYISLGGNRRSLLRNYMNLWVVFLLTGFWHGAAWTFILWGMYHGILLTFERALNVKGWGIPGFVKQGITFILVMIGWTIFRAEGLQMLIPFLKVMFGFEGAPYAPYLPGVTSYSLVVLWSCFLFSVIDLKKVKEYLSINIYVKGITALSFTVLALIKFSATSFTPFIYFKF